MGPLKAQLLAAIESLPDVEVVVWRERSDGFTTLNYRSTEIAHFHHDNELDLALGKALIKQQGLQHPPNSIKHPKRSASSAYIELRFNSAGEVDEVVRLIKLAVADRQK
ncbi:luciferase family protein [Pseudomonas sp. NPDC078700]|uniref:luciferase domain-containing protein n=1 Tax=Pseudomonas sp. NPDC078700 TaxID=3364424 RepID=UPI0037C68061